MFGTRENDEALIIGRVLSGEREAFGFLVKRHLPAVYAVAYARTHNHADAEDVAQEAFLSALQSLDRLREPRKFVAWTVSIARRVAADTFRARARRSEGEPPEWGEDARPAVERAELFALVDRELGEIDDASREVLLLHYFAGRNGREIAHLLGISQGAVRKRLQRAREVLGARILSEVGDEKDVRAMLAQPVERISCAALAVPVAWKVGTATASPVGASSLNVAMAVVKLAVGATCVVGVATLWAVYAQKGGPPVSMTAPAPPRVAPLDTVLTSERPPRFSVHVKEASTSAQSFPSAALEDADAALLMLKEIDYDGAEDGAPEDEGARWQHFIGRVEELLALTSDPLEQGKLEYCLAEAYKISKAFDKLLPLYEKFLGSEEFNLLEESLRSQTVISAMGVYGAKYTNGGQHQISDSGGREKLEQVKRLARGLQAPGWLGIPASMAVESIYNVATSTEPSETGIEDRFIADLIVGEDILRGGLQPSEAARAVMPGLHTSSSWSSDLLRIYEMPEFQPLLEKMASSDPELYLRCLYYVALNMSGDFPDKGLAIALHVLQELSPRDPYCGWFYYAAAYAEYQKAAYHPPGNFDQCVTYLRYVNSDNCPPRHKKGYWSPEQLRKRALSGGR